MSIVVSDAGPIQYLIQAGAAEVLPALFGQVIIPQAVVSELTHENAPPEVVKFISNPPNWVQVMNFPIANLIPKLGLGETAAIQGALSLRCVLLVDDRNARQEAKRLGIVVTGTVGTIERAAYLGLLNLDETVRRLLQTNIRLTPDLLKLLGK